MYPQVAQLESRRRELASVLGLTEDPWAAAAARERDPRQRPRLRRRARLQTRLRPAPADEC